MDFFHRERPDVQEGDDTARAGLTPLELPWKRADDAAGVEDLLNVATDVLGVDAPLGKGKLPIFSSKRRARSGRM
jgi:hypothetical protein